MIDSKIWREVPDFPGYYACDDGRIGSAFERDGETWKISDRIMRILKPAYSFGYYRVNLSRNGKRNFILVHKIIARTFIGECPEGYEICHNDGNSTNNAASNLRYDTHTMNILDKTGLSMQQIAEIKSCTSKSELKQLSNTYGISYNTALGIRSGFSFNVTEPKKKPKYFLTGRLSEQDIKNIRQMHESGKSLSCIGKMFGIANSTVSKICNRQRYEYVE